MMTYTPYEISELISLVGINCVIALLGKLGNACIVTFMDRPLKNNVQLFICTVALANIIADINFYITLFFLLSKNHFLNLQTCILIQFVPYFGFNMCLLLLLTIGVGGLFTVIFPMNSFFNFHHKNNKTYFVSLILIISVVNMGWIVHDYEKMMIFEENKVVLCTVLEFFKNDIHTRFWLCLIICIIYLVLWIAIESKKRLIHTSETRRVMKPLSVFAIIITLTWFGIFISDIVITNYVAEHVLLIINLSLLNIGISCHFLVYYVMSDEYRNAFIRLRSYFLCQKKKTKRRNHVVPMYAYSITQTLMVVPLKPIEKLQHQQQQQQQQHLDDDLLELHNIGFM